MHDEASGRGVTSPIGGSQRISCLAMAGAALLLAICLFAWFVLKYDRYGDEARSASSRQSLKHIGLAVLMYDDAFEAMPPDLQTLYSTHYVKDPAVFEAPRGSRVDVSRIDETSFYEYAPIRRAEAPATQPYPEDAPILWEKAPILRNGEIVVLYADGHARRITRDELALEVDRFADLYFTKPRLPAGP